eukprot:jgi/Ulvmu1/6893/UM031_0099.1
MEEANHEASCDIEIVFKYSTDECTVLMLPEETVEDLKRRLSDMTSVRPSRQKLIGLKLKTGKPATDDSEIADLKLKKGQKFMMLGSPEHAIEVAGSAADVTDIVDDLQMQEDVFEALQPHEDPDVLAKLERRIKAVDIKVLNDPRPGKKLLVIDIDYTIFDLGSSAERPMDLARPHLHKFLASAYEDYDIVVWSANSMKWMNVKMKALGVLTHTDFKIAFMLDYKSMLTLHTERYGVFDCKPLQLLWSKFSEHYNADNTIMLDDLRRNYIMNKQNGLVIRPFRKAYQNRATDRELVKIKYYLQVIAGKDTFAKLNHKVWESYTMKKLKQNSPDVLRQLQEELLNP